RVEAAVADRRTVDPGQRLLDQRGIGEGDRGAQQGALDLLAVSRLAALVKRGQRAEGREAGGAEIDPRDLAGDRLLGLAGEVDRAAHCLADAVEAVLVAERAAGAKPGHRRQEDRKSVV